MRYLMYCVVVVLCPIACTHDRILVQASTTDTRTADVIAAPSEIDDFHRHLARLRASHDPVAPSIADLLEAMSERNVREKLQRCTTDQSSPLRIAVLGRTTITEDGIADEIEVGLSRHADFNVSGRRALSDVNSSKVEEHGGLFADKTIQPVGAFAGLDALGVVTVRHVNKFAIATIHIICTRTLEEVASARASFPKVEFTAPDEDPSDIVLQRRTREEQQSRERIAQCQQHPKDRSYCEEIERSRYRKQLRDDLAKQMREADRLLKEVDEGNEGATEE